MTNEEIKKIVDDERVEQLTVQACHHWEIATQRLEELTKELDVSSRLKESLTIMVIALMILMIQPDMVEQSVPLSLLFGMPSAVCTTSC